MAKTFDDMSKIENPLKNEPIGAFQEYRKNGTKQAMLAPVIRTKRSK